MYENHEPSQTNHVKKKQIKKIEMKYQNSTDRTRDVKRNTLQHNTIDRLLVHVVEFRDY